MRDEDDDGQIDGDAPVQPFVGARRVLPARAPARYVAPAAPAAPAAPYVAPGQPGSPFAASFGAQPWLRSPLPPWHTWGTIEFVQSIATANTLPANFNGIRASSQQLTRVNYKRPDTWQWFFYARLISAPNGGGGGAPAEAAVIFDVTIGLGRASVTVVGFEQFSWSWAAAPPLDDVKWSAAARQPARSPTDTLDHSLDKIVAQDIQVNARFANSAPGAPPDATPCKFEIGSFFAPRSHIRPDWLIDNAPPEAKFPGDEIGGR